MNILKSIGRWLCIFLMSVCLSAWIILATTQATIFNRATAKTWLTSSGVYTQPIGKVLRIMPQSTTGADKLISDIILQQALNKTFPPSYVQEQANTVIDKTYDWLAGKANAVTFNIPIQNKSAEFSANLASQLEPILAKLPTCNKFITQDSSIITCVPRGVSAADYAQQLTGTNFLSAPLTQDALTQGSAPQLGWLPATAQWTQTATWLLPIAWIVLGALYVLLSVDKLRSIGIVGRQAVINSVLLLAGGLLLWLGSSSIDLSNTLSQGDAGQTAIVANVINPLARTILPDVGKMLSLYSGSAVVTGVILWAGTFVWRRQLKKPLQISSAPAVPTPSGETLPPTTPTSQT